MKWFVGELEKKMMQYVFSIGGGLLVAFETSLPFIAPCFLAVLIDVVSAYLLARRVHSKYPDRADGKFKSRYKFKIVYTLIVGLAMLLLAGYVDNLILKTGNRAVCAVTCVFLFYQIWSILENLSSECNSGIARALQRIMVNKAERHLNVPLDDLLKVGGEPNKNNEVKETRDGDGQAK